MTPSASGRRETLFFSLHPKGPGQNGQNEEEIQVGNVASGQLKQVKHRPITRHFELSRNLGKTL